MANRRKCRPKIGDVSYDRGENRVLVYLDVKPGPGLQLESTPPPHPLKWNGVLSIRRKFVDEDSMRCGEDFH